MQTLLIGKVHERFSGGVLAGFGLLFFLMAAGKLVTYFSGHGTTSWSASAVNIADLLVAPVWVTAGLLLWKKRSFGYLSGAGLFFQASMLFVGLLVFFILQPFVTSVPFPLSDFLVVAFMSLFCFVPFGLYLHGILMTKG